MVHRVKVLLLAVLLVASGVVCRWNPAAYAQHIVTLPTEIVCKASAGLRAQFSIPALRLLQNSSFSRELGPEGWAVRATYLGEEAAATRAQIERDTDPGRTRDGAAAYVRYATSSTGVVGVAFEQSGSAWSGSAAVAPFLRYWIRYQYDSGTSDTSLRGGFVGVRLLSEGQTYELRYYHGSAGQLELPASEPTIRYVRGEPNRLRSWIDSPGEGRYWDIGKDASDAFGLADFSLLGVRFGVLMQKSRSNTSYLYYMFDDVELNEGGLIWHEFREAGESDWQKTQPVARIGDGDYSALVSDLRPDTTYETRAVLCYLGELFHGEVHAFTTSSTSSTSRTEHLLICSFNITWLGHYTRRDNVALSNLLEGFDIVVVQELVAPPYEMSFPDGSPAQPSDRSRAFFDEMLSRGFSYWLSEEDTGPGERIHTNSTSTEWWVVFYKPDIVLPARDLQHGFLSARRANNLDYRRVPYAFSFRTVCGSLDFVIISVHLHPGPSSADARTRADEIHAVAEWVASRPCEQTDYLIVGDMNTYDCAELHAFVPPPFHALNSQCIATNTSPRNPKPYDNVLYNPVHTTEMDEALGFQVISLVDEMAASWSGLDPYPGDPYCSVLFPQYYSDHNPIWFRLIVPEHSDN